MNTTQERQKLFREKCELSYAKGGFLTVDLGSNWQLDIEEMESFNAETARLMEEEFKKILEQFAPEKERYFGAHKVEMTLDDHKRNFKKEILQSLTE